MSEGPIELIDEKGTLVGFVRRLPTPREIEFAKRRVGKPGPKFTVDQLIAKVEAT